MHRITVTIPEEVAQQFALEHRDEGLTTTSGLAGVVERAVVNALAVEYTAQEGGGDTQTIRHAPLGVGVEWRRHGRLHRYVDGEGVSHPEEDPDGTTAGLAGVIERAVVRALRDAGAAQDAPL